MWTLKIYSRSTKTTNEPTASNHKSDRPQVKIWDTWKTLKYLNINESFHFITGFFSRMSTQVKAEVRSTNAVTWVRKRKKKPVISNTGKFFSFNNNVSKLYNNSVVKKIYGMAYIFTLLMFRKSTSTSFRFSFIFRYFKVFQVKRIVYI
jgi:hypothetical protein